MKGKGKRERKERKRERKEQKGTRKLERMKEPNGPRSGDSQDIDTGKRKESEKGKNCSGHGSNEGSGGQTGAGTAGTDSNMGTAPRDHWEHGHGEHGHDEHHGQ